MRRDTKRQIIRNKTGQAALELAIFGSILIMLLGVLINYGLRYNYQQQVMQEAFRKALGVAAGGAPSSNYVLVKDRHIPNPSDPFGVGSVIPVSASGSVVRDFELYKTADSADELAHIDIEIAGGEVRSYKTVAFRDEYNVPLTELEDDYDANGNGSIDDDEEGVSKYDYIYGFEGTGWWVKDGEEGEGECLGTPEIEINPETGIPLPPRCRDEDKTKNIRILDDCAGEIIDYDMVQNRCYQIGQAGINPPPWYCDENYRPQASLFREDIFTAYSDVPDISELRDEDKPKMGLQGGYTQDALVNNTLSKTESLSDITATDTLDWHVTTERTIVYNDGIIYNAGADDDGLSSGNIDPKKDPVTTKVSPQDKIYEWQTPF